VIGLPSAVFVLFGQNIGTCITAVLASIGTNRNAKRATIIHLMFNVIGTVIFTILFLVFPFNFWYNKYVIEQKYGCDFPIVDCPLVLRKRG